MAAPRSNTMKHSRFRLQPLTKPKLIVTGTRSSATAAKKVHADGARTMGFVLANYTDCPDESGNRSGPGRRQACVRCDDGYEKDRHRRNRGRTPRLKLKSPHASGSKR